jgi:hypothetical protein
MNARRYIRPTKMRGQAMTELLICAAAILVPLFLIVPAFGKFIDMKHTAIKAARYEAWEYTVWYAEDCERKPINIGKAEECPMSGFDNPGEIQPFKSRAATKAESTLRFFGSPDGTALTAPVASVGAPTPSNRLWFDHTGTQMYGDIVGGGEPVSSKKPAGIPVLSTILDLVLGAVKLIFGAFGAVLGFAGSDAGFDAINTDGLATATVNVTMESEAVRTLMSPVAGPVLPELTFSSSAAVLTDGWGTGGREHTYNQASGMIVTSGLKAIQNLPVISTVWDIVTAIIAPELRRCNQPNYLENPYNLDDPHWDKDKGSLWFGHIDSEAVHRDRLDDGSETHTCDKAGRCDFDDTFTREKECIP